MQAIYDVIPREKRIQMMWELGEMAATMMYTSDGITVNMPNNHWVQRDVRRYLTSIGLSEVEYGYYFPLGTDKPPQEQRVEFYKYPGQRSFWYRTNWRIG